ncbi:hypothetical protein EJ04DRAFT_485357 [Polyplosphaeria fusca]|uniref:Fungal N-terminal domain-containing protein n=1 Tax=Polyplosphaeria fusca TaxID=682080 RepID=A0A9P4R8V4_9PLEO|nr:hypothetical protein EJ04DRAFT_485357 [Polyplosphaeria fusca]
MSFGVSIGDILKLCELATRVYKNCRDSTGDFKTLTAESRSLTNLLQDVADKVEGGSIPESKKQQLFDTYQSCVDVLSELDKVVSHYNSLDSKTKRAWDRVKWDPDRSKALREKLTSTVVMLNSFYSSLIHDNQVLILEALGRLEKDYRGGYREESLASVEQIVSGNTNDENEDDEDAAWPQIIRDLEDVGISSQAAITYRDLIITWFVKAVNEGRLVEELEPRASSTSSQELVETFPRLEVTTLDDEQQSPPHGRIEHKPNERLASSSSASNRSSTIKVEGLTDATFTPQLQSLTNGNIPSNVPAPNVTFPLSEPWEYTAPPSYQKSNAALESTLAQRASLIVKAWKECDFTGAGALLETQLAAVERGEAITRGVRTFRPDHRLLRHLIGVCASYSGDFSRGKIIFENILSNVSLHGASVDDGTIAAARWLGDICLHLKQPENAALAWAVALYGLIAQEGVEHSETRQTFDELNLLNFRLHAFKILSKSLLGPEIDPDSLFLQRDVMEKSRFIDSIQECMKQFKPNKSLQSLTEGIFTAPSLRYKTYRTRVDSTVAEAVLIQPPASQAAWPLPWDPTFSPVEAINLYNSVTVNPYNTNPSAFAFPYDSVPTIGLGLSKSLHYVTKRSIRWLVEMVRLGLEQLDIQYKIHGPLIICRVTQCKKNLVYSAGIAIEFKKLQFRNTFGLKVSEALFATRGIPVESGNYHGINVDIATDGFRSIIRDMLEKAERGHDRRDLGLPDVKDLLHGGTEKDLEVAKS